jgi:ABC-type uncharacterized transport system permease subunit
MFVEIIMQTGIYWFLAMGLWLSLRVVRYADLALENTLVLGGMLTCWQSAHVDLGGAWKLVGSLVATSAALSFVAWLAWKRLRVHAVIVSLSVGYMVYAITLHSFGSMLEGSGLPKLRADATGLLVVYALVFLVSGIFHIVRHSPTGRRFLAAVSNPPLAATLGMCPGVWQWAGLMVANLLILLSGTLHACYYTYVNIGDAAGFLLLGIFAAIFIANGLCPRVHGFQNGLAGIAAVGLFQTVITSAIYSGVPVNLIKGVMGLLLILAVSALRFRRTAAPITIG